MEEFFLELKKLAPNAAVLSSCYEEVCPRPHHYPPLPSLPPTIMSLSRIWYRDLDGAVLAGVYQQLFDELEVTAEEANF